MRTVRAGLVPAIIGLQLMAAAAAGPKCTCLTTEGKRVEKGEVACLHLPTGDALARCDTVLNNTSWTKLREGCEVS